MVTLPMQTITMPSRFYIAFGTPILFYVLYQLNQTTPDSRPFISRLIEKYTEKQDAYQKRTELHMKAVEQAAFDKQLFKTEDKTGLSRGINLRHPEQFNNGSPYNVSAGQSGADLSKLVAYYREKNEQAEDLRTSKVRDNNGKVRSVYETTPIEGAVKATPHT
ncbi:putative nadh-ubiquinone oxidoreductase 178 kda subunit [Phaeomoniella chlamydospora]|uniref:Putative nadh-ubiquinone oxidoreductase 178 kDa subunit n=1 Tax=Phaeomoniella chlamydospora TaxID=158046 RepID=A0A0G2EQ82_PHACM|nr:putative nadh-ubiquinone oxidoreductase 178 kda subunit [Phaeomoniella chlamydospora]